MSDVTEVWATFTLKEKMLWEIHRTKEAAQRECREFPGAVYMERLPLLTPAHAAVIEAAKALVDVIAPPKDTTYREYQAAAGELCVRVSVLRALEGDA
jgi:hypothetical protein